MAPLPAVAEEGDAVAADNLFLCLLRFPMEGPVLAMAGAVCLFCRSGTGKQQTEKLAVGKSVQ